MILAQKILNWFDQYGRHNLPWQHRPTPYRVWISEIMLQQTQVTTVIPYFERFIKRFPDISTLAKASLDEVLSLWAGLGYYARAKNLYQTAQIINTKYHNQFPTNYEQVIALPGIGRSTAGAILALSTKQRYPILDGNVKRVLARHFAIAGWTGAPKTLETLWKLSEKITPHSRIHHYTQAMMDLGATICTRTKPKCNACPIAKSCKAKKLKAIDLYPSRRPKKEKPIKATQVILLLDPKYQYILLEKRPSQGIWSGLWSLPECALDTDIPNWCEQHLHSIIKTFENLDPFQHTFTHFHLNIHPVLCKVKRHKLKSLKHQWHPWEEINCLGLPAPIKRLLEKVKEKSNATTSFLYQA